MNKYTFDEINIGDAASFAFPVTEEVVDNFAAFSGDENPLHTNSEYARATEFKGRVAHGMIGGCLFSKLVGVYLPGEYCLYLSQTLQFKKPIFLGTMVEVSGKVTQKVEAFKTIEIETSIKNIETGERMIEGKALVKLLK
ncbi:MAG: MaoC family dehydratase [Candidatus Magasanikbacteria bacterium]|nr:MaoC family dehydratase [Candidatus Magasanikbacteria bacterium]